MKAYWRPIIPIQFDSRGVLQQCWELGYFAEDSEWRQLRVEWRDVPRDVPNTHWCTSEEM